jgi:hypothetical protein
MSSAVECFSKLRSEMAAAALRGRVQGGRSGARHIWEAVDALLARTDPEGAWHHALGALQAQRLRRLGLPVPEPLEREERTAMLVAGMAVPVLEHVRRSCDGPLVLFKGPEVARLYPPGARAFGDLDLVTPRAEAAQRQLLDAGFREDQLGVLATYHLQPVIWEKFPLEVELHHQFKWPGSLRRPPLEEILEARVPSALGVEGVLAPRPAHHALILAAHAWEHRPLRLVRDLLDVALISAEADEGEIERTAAAWGLGPLWRTTRRAVACLFEDGRRPVSLHTWARHLPTVRDRTVLESHLEHWMSPFWGRPFGRALANTPTVLAREMKPLPGEGWRDKLNRTLTAICSPTTSLGRRDADLEGASRSRGSGSAFRV